MFMFMFMYHIESNIDDPCEEESGPADGHHGGDCGGGQGVFSSRVVTQLQIIPQVQRGLNCQPVK